MKPSHEPTVSKDKWNTKENNGHKSMNILPTAVCQKAPQSQAEAMSNSEKKSSL